MQTRKITLMALCVAMNVVGSFIVLTTKLPLFLDTAGTMLVAFLYGPVMGALAGALTYVISGSTFDPVGYFFIPSQIAVGLTAGWLFKKGFFRGSKTIIGIIIIILINTIVAATIATFVFDGVTSSGTSYIVQGLKAVGVSIFYSVFSTQLASEAVDKTMMAILALTILKRLPANLKHNIEESKKFLK